MNVVRIALYQATTGIDPDENARDLTHAIGQAAEAGAAMLFTPEMSGLLDRNSKRASANIRSADQDQVLAKVRTAAATHKVWVHLGSLAVRTAGGKIANRAFVVDPEGEVRATYDKMHLFDVDLPTGETWRESAVYSGGNKSVLVDNTPVGRLGLTICYDLRFPALFSTLAENGAAAISVPAAFTVPTGKAHWQILLRARAIEASVFVIAAAQVGRHEDGRETYGHSMVVGPWGDALLNMGEERGVGIAELDLAEIEAVRSRLPALHHRRLVPEPDVRP